MLKSRVERTEISWGGGFALFPYVYLLDEIG
jgi:hypothetical protein